MKRYKPVLRDENKLSVKITDFKDMDFHTDDTETKQQNTIICSKQN